MRKGQVTLFAILGIVILIVFFLIYGLLNSLKPPAQKGSTESIFREIETGIVRNHVVDCMGKIVQQGVERLGLEGGYLYDYNGGTIPFASRVRGDDYVTYTPFGLDYNVAFGLKENSYCTNIDYSVPGYPYADKKLSEVAGLYGDCSYKRLGGAYDGFFGEVTLPKLCSSEEEDCETFARGAEIGLTMQKQLEDYLASNLALCVNMTRIGDNLDANITDGGVVESKISIRDAELLVYVRYPVIVTYKKEAPVRRIIEYSSSVKMRFEALYNFIYAVLSSDARKYSYDPVKDFISEPTYLDGFSVKRITNVCVSCGLPHQNDDLLEFIDKKSSINGKAMMFRTAIEDRRVALDLLEQEYSYDLANAETGIVDIPLYAYDPDDGPVEFEFLSEGTYPGWHDTNESIQEFGGLWKVYIPLSFIDYGQDHKVGVLATDDSGTFDVQYFEIDVDDTSLSFPLLPECMDVCVNEYYMDMDYCDSFCWVSANPCNSDCAGVFSAGGDACYACFETITNSAVEEWHTPCDILSEFGCKETRPDCFWLLQTPGFGGLCADDKDLPLALMPSFIEK